MGTYQIVRIDNGHETILMDTDEIKKAKDYYLYCNFQNDKVRVRIDGKTLCIFEANKWAGFNGKAACSKKRRIP